MEQIFRIDDTVYHFEYGEGKVVMTNFNSSYPIVVKFDELTVPFTSDGRNSTEQRTLSHTPYDLVNGGFSQREPLPDIKRGTPVFVKAQNGKLWQIRVFSHFDENGKLHAFIDADLTGSTKEWDVYSLENPINYDEEI